MWYKTLGYKINPFTTDAKRAVDTLIKYDVELENLLYWIESGSIILVEGPSYSGKTRLAMEVIENFKGYGKVIYLDLSTYSQELDISHILIGNQSFHRKFLNLMPKDMILIIDNATTLKSDFYKRLQYFYDQDYLRSVLFIRKSEFELNLPESVLDRIAHKKILLKDLAKKDSIKIVKNRLKEDFFSDEQLEYVWNKSRSFPTFMFNLETIAKAFVDENKKRMDQKFIDKVLS